MKFQKKTIEKQDHCYAVEVMKIHERPYAFFAAENHGSCFAINCDTLRDRKQIWTEPGGTMSIAEIPNRDGEFLAVQKFFRLWDWEEACLVWVKPAADGTWQAKKLFTLPYLHRFDILKRDGRNWLIACTLASHKKTLADWSCPGGVYVTELPSDWDGAFELKELRSDFYQNHGYFRLERRNYNEGLITCEQGVFVFTPPAAGSSKWNVKQIMTQPTSDAAMIDIDGDGKEEIATIERFHGCYFRIYKNVNGKWKQIFEHPEVTEFYHVVKAGTLCGKKVFIGGCRRGKQQLFVVTWDNITKKPIIQVMDEGVGPSNAVIYNGSNGDRILVANREAGEATCYFVED